jgi:4-amino-4-deoxy-L-arabinose transferase-like glycosyltransferase
VAHRKNKVIPKTPPSRIKKAARSRNALAISIGLLILLTVLLRVRLLEIPLERDEGGYAYTASQLLEGVPPFAEAYDVKMPFLYVLYAGFIALFGKTIAGIHLGLLIFSAMTAILIYLLGRRILDESAGLAAGVLYSVLSISQHVQGFVANTEQLLLPFALTGVLFYLKGTTNKPDVAESIGLRATAEEPPAENGSAGLFFASGLMLGIAFIVKHHAIFFAAAIGLHYLLKIYFNQPRKGVLLWKHLTHGALLLSGMILPFAIQTLIYVQLGLFDKYYYWLFKYIRLYNDFLSFAQGMEELWKSINELCGPMLLVFLMAASGFVAVLKNGLACKHRMFLSLFLVFSFLSVCPDLMFMPHYWILFLPALALCGGIAAGLASRLLKTEGWILTGGLVLLSGGYLIAKESDYLFNWTPTQISRECYRSNPFPESLPIAEYIRKHTAPTDKIAIMGSEPQILFYSQRKSVTPYIYTYPLMKNFPDALKMQKEMIRSIEQQQPKVIVMATISSSWMATSNSDSTILSWCNTYIPQKYQLVGLADILSPETVYRWDREVEGYAFQSRYWLGIFERRQ